MKITQSMEKAFVQEFRHAFDNREEGRYEGDILQSVHDTLLEKVCLTDEETQDITDESTA